jgi:hypothetical protein
LKARTTYTVEEYREVMVKQRKKIVDGEIPNAYADYLDKQLTREPSPWLCSSGIRGLERGDRPDETKQKAGAKNRRGES